MIEKGQLYRHYKGHQYYITTVAKHSETLEEMIVYERDGDPADVWVRPKKMFEEKLKDGRQRFELIK